MELNNHPERIESLNDQLQNLQKEKIRLQCLIAMTSSYKKAIKEIDNLMLEINRYIKKSK